MSKHIVTAFDAELQSISTRISEMGGLAEEQLSQALEAIRERDSELAAEVIAADVRLDKLEVDFEEFAIQMLALRQPMANDLREVVAALKIASTLERIGDLAKNISRRATYLNENQPIKVSSSIVRMGNQTRLLVSEVLDAYAARDTALAVSVWTRDVEIDEMYNSIFRELITYMMEDQHLIGLCSQLLFVAKNLERIGDHATFISEMIYYVVEGRPLGDSRPKGEPLGELPLPRPFHG
ncbi:phosphate signaling complex protein PhoU [Paralimibaculum aggregatum]|uniref:Phosphate-specific transport system accessory protein PhoU n=1 Tax=Paralimibaculum aggregatum TaxID=3036245 RepID=A0ABQ6LFJ2_9RHOB|nr:phosphate signaling complex protein PhoU [Limibaculum sp. NKW23]GMG81747.1 phosphate signaling complex protein PhoU [Limibaculum sp. NKW23]